MRRLALIGFMLGMLVACGRSAQLNMDSQANQMVGYPTPLAASVEPLVEITFPTATVSITHETKPLTITLNQSFPLQKPQQFPYKLAGWSPNDQYLLYTQVTSSIRTIPSLHVLSGRLVVLDLETGIPTVISDENAIVGIVDNGYAFEGNQPQWTTMCCQIVASFINGEQQSILQFDYQGKEIKTLKTMPRSLTDFYDEQLRTLSEPTYQSPDSQRRIPLISQTSWLTATSFVNSGLYTHDGTDLQYIDNDGNTWTIQGQTSFLTKHRHNRIARMQPSADGSWIAVITAEGRSWDRSLWIIDRTTQVMTIAAEGYKLANPAWSADTQYLTYTLAGHLVIYNRLTQEQIQVDGDFGMIVWHPTEPKFAVINDAQSRVDIFQVEQ